MRVAVPPLVSPFLRDLYAARQLQPEHRMTRPSFFLSSVLSLSICSTAFAQATSEATAPTSSAVSAAPMAPAPATTVTVSRWYGWEPLIADAASAFVGFSVAAGASFNPSSSFGSSPVVPAAAILSLGGYVAVPPLLHELRGHPGKMAASLALRIGLPLLTGAIGYAIGASADRSLQSGPIDSDAPGDQGVRAILYTLFAAPAGMVIASAIDIAAISREDVTSAPPEPKLTFEPRLGMVTGGATAGIGGTF